MNKNDILDAAPGCILRDSKVAGLHMRVGAAKRSWLLYYRTREHRERRYKIGEYPAMTPGQARTRARELLGQIASGADPAGDQKAARKAPRVRDLLDRYLAEHAALKKTGAEDKRMIDRYVRPRLDTMKVADVKRADVANLHSSMKDAPYQANRVLAMLSKIMNLAEAWEMRPVGSNPCARIARFKEKSRRRYMTPAEATTLAGVMAELEEERPQAIAFLYLLILTGARLSEIAGARWDQLDGQRLHLDDSKTGRRVIYLSAHVMQLLDKLPHTSGTITGIASPRATWDEVKRRAGVDDLRLHDLRHSFASAGLAAGLTLAQIGELLGHKVAQTTQRYAHLMDEPAVEAADRAADYISCMMEKA